MSVETPVKCAEAGVGTAVLLWARQQHLGRGAQPRAPGRAMCREQRGETNIAEN